MTKHSGTSRKQAVLLLAPVLSLFEHIMLDLLNSDTLVRFSEHFLFYTFNIGLENQELGHAQNSNFIFGKYSPQSN